MATPNAAPARPGRAGQEMRRIGLWGATQSGKSTFLAALYIAVSRAEHDLRIFGVNDPSTDFLVRNTSLLNSKHRFPEGTEFSEQLSWTMSMRVQARRWLSRQVNPTVPFNFRIDLQDAPGRVYRAIPEEEEGAGESALPSRLDIGDSADPDVASYLAGCHGALLLIDPLRERRLGDAHEYFHGTLLRMAQRAMPNVPAGQRLPHYVAVCVTKFDDPDVYVHARDNGHLFLADSDPHAMPRVTNSDAERFLHELCRGWRKSDVELVTSALGKYFYPDRIRYFVTSAVGFYLDDDGSFRDEDYQNVVPEEGVTEADKPTVMIRGRIHPINVVEPLLWLGESVAAGR